MLLTFSCYLLRLTHTISAHPFTWHAFSFTLSLTIIFFHTLILLFLKLIFYRIIFIAIFDVYFMILIIHQKTIIMKSKKDFSHIFLTHSVLWQRPLEDGGTCLLSHHPQTNASDHHVRKIQRLISIHSNTHFLSPLTSAPCPILVGTPFIYGKDPSFNFFFFSLFFPLCISNPKIPHLCLYQKVIGHKRRTLLLHSLCIFFPCFIHILQFHSLLFLSWRSWFTCHLCSCFCLCCYLVFSIGFYFWVIPLLDPWPCFFFFVLVFVFLLFFSLNLIQ